MPLTITTSKSFENSSYFEKSFLEKKWNQFKETINSPEIGFFKLPNDNQLLDESIAAYKKFKHKKVFVHIGIGGSSLGPEMLISALNKNHNVDFRFINNIDPDETHQQLSNFKLEDTLFYFVSKSGGTAETMASLAIIHNILEQANIPKEKYKDYMVFATDPNKSQLLDLGSELNITCLEIPSNVGGRFCVLSPVGFLPALFAGINCDQLLQGALETSEKILQTPTAESDLLKTASFLMHLKDQGVDQTIFMPYSSKLRNLSFWFIQLWAESLGKKTNNGGDVVHTGLTPIPGYGATDQHSQMQLFMEGPYNKALLMLDVKNFDHDFSLKNDFSQKSLSNLASFSLSQLMKAEFEGTLKALEDAKRPYIRFSIQNRDEKSLGALILFLESLTALMGHYLNINPFDQPGVEAGKQYAQQWLSTSRQ